MTATPGRAPRSREAVRAMLSDLGLRAHKRFGQHFLADGAVLDRIVARSGVRASSVVLEVGPGLGTLTERLLASGAAVVAVEVDHGLARHLRVAFEGVPGFVLLERDVMARKGRMAEEVGAALRAQVADRRAGGFDVVSNLPYGISSSFLASLAFEPGPPLSATVMLQAEVARALGARASTEDYSALAAFMRTYFGVRREFAVGRHAFFPEPDVDSTVVRLVPKTAGGPPPEAFSRFVQALFKSRRKTIATPVRSVLALPSAAAARAWLSDTGFDPIARADSMEPERIVGLFEKVVEAGRPGGGILGV